MTEQEEAEVALQDEQIATFEASFGSMADAAPFFSDEKLARRYLALYNLWPETEAATNVGVPTAAAEPHCHGRNVDQSHKPQLPCPPVGGQCHGIMRREAHHGPAGYRYKCNKRINGIKCGKTMAATQGARTTSGPKGSMIFGCKIKPNDLFTILFCMIHNLGRTVIRDLTKLSLEVITNFTSMVKESMMQIVFMEYDSEGGMIGGPGMIVEIDETKLARRKSNVGQILASEVEWVFGGICRHDKRAFKVRVTGRGMRHLIPLMKRFIAPGSIIVSDGWSAYSCIPQHQNWQHYWVNHSENFVNPQQTITGATFALHDEEPVHTQTIERYWRDTKSMVKVYDDKNGMADREIHVHTYFCNRFGRGKSQVCPRARLQRLVEDLGRTNPVVGQKPVLPDWVKFEPELQNWTALTGSLKVLKGYNILGLGYHDEGLPEHEIIPEHHWNDDANVWGILLDSGDEDEDFFGFE